MGAEIPYPDRGKVRRPTGPVPDSTDVQVER